MNDSAIVMSIFMASPFSNVGLRHLFSFIDDFWPYSYHQRKYNAIIELFTADMNLLSVLRLNPFGDYNLEPEYPIYN